MRVKNRSADPVRENQAFLEGLYGRMKPLLLRLIRSMNASESETEDILQESFLRLWEKVDRLRSLPEKKCFSYVYTTVKNTALKQLRSASRQPGLSLEDTEAPETGPGPEEYLLTLEKEGQFRAAMAELDERTRQLLTLRYLLEEDDRHIAEALAVQPDSVRMMLTRARKRLKTEMMRLEDSGKGEKK